MMQKLEVTEGGETTLLAGEQVDQLEMDEANQKATDGGLKLAEGRPVLLGIPKASLQTRSVFSAASFQETTRVLTDAAVNGKVDTLEGLKENVIVRPSHPAGTGGAIARLRQCGDGTRPCDPGGAGEDQRAGSPTGRPGAAGSRGVAFLPRLRGRVPLERSDSGGGGSLSPNDTKRAAGDSGPFVFPTVIPG